MPPTETADLILADPPYGIDLVEKLFEKSLHLGHEGTIWLLETESGLKLPKILKDYPAFTLLKDKQYNNNILWILRQEQAA